MEVTLLHDVIEPTVDSAQIVMDKMEEEGRLYDEYLEKIKRWKELMKLVKYSKPTLMISMIICFTTSTNCSKSPRTSTCGKVNRTSQSWLCFSTIVKTPWHLALKVKSVT